MLSLAVLRQLEAYPWPGNVRELGNVLERAVLLSAGDLVESAELPRALIPVAAPGEAGVAPPAPAVEPEPTTLRDAVEDAERRAIRAALRRTGGNKTRAAEVLQVSIRTLWYKLDKLGIEENG